VIEDFVLAALVRSGVRTDFVYACVVSEKDKVQRTTGKGLVVLVPEALNSRAVRRRRVTNL